MATPTPGQEQVHHGVVVQPLVWRNLLSCSDFTGLDRLVGGVHEESDVCLLLIEFLARSIQQSTQIVGADGLLVPQPAYKRRKAIRQLECSAARRD
jgi:hypothetical protein